MASRFQAAALVVAPSCPNAVVWSEENLIAVAAGHLVTILNPALPYGPRGLITLPECEPYLIGVVKREDLLSSCMLSTCLKRDRRSFVRSISWSPIGMATNSGCLLAVCTTEGRVKIYRPPFCDFGAEWIEVLDISDGLYDYLASINFGELEISSAGFCIEGATEHASIDGIRNSVPRKERKRRRVNVSGVINKDSGSNMDTNVGSSPSVARGFEIKSCWLKEKNSYQTSTVSKSKGKPASKIFNSDALPMITADQYASRSSMLHSLVVAWSPVLKFSSRNCPVSLNDSSNCFSVLAVGGKCGKISFWRISMPECYSIEHSEISTSAVLIGLLQAHNSWTTTISWGIISSDSSNPQVLLVTGSSDGSVRMWLAYGKELLKSTEVELTSFSLLKEVIAVNAAPISVLSIFVPVQSPHQILLAVGKGSGSFEVWICDISSNKFDKAGSFDAHDQVVTGLTWVFGGRCLYSCCQDNTVRSWILRGSFLSDIPIPSNTPGLKSSTDLPDVFFSCLGVAVSPGNLVLAMVRSFDLDTLDPMYEARAQKAAVEFLWIGGQQIDASSSTFLEYGLEGLSVYRKNEFDSWVANILWSLKQFERVDRALVVWDVIAALLAFKQSVPEYVEFILVKWLSTLHPESQQSFSSEQIVSYVSKNVANISSRRLHLLNIICRCVLLLGLKADQVNRKLQNLGGLCGGTTEEQLDLWMELLSNSERELRERLVGLNFASFLCLTAHSASSFSQPGHWYPVGIAQMEQWVAHNPEQVQNELKVLASEVVERKSRIHFSEQREEEQCSYCSASVPFDSLEFAFCQGSECIGRVPQPHKLVRCAASMQVCPTTPLWYCKCCHRWTHKLAPETLFKMSGYPVNFKQLTESSVEEEISKPLCPLCGILLQRLLPEFLLSASPV